MPSLERPGFLERFKQEFIQYEPGQIWNSGVAGAALGWIEIPMIFMANPSTPYIATATTLLAPFILPPLARVVEKYMSIIILKDNAHQLKWLEENTRTIPGSSEAYAEYRVNLGRKVDLQNNMKLRRQNMKAKGYKHKLWDHEVLPYKY